jgi:hypothetical protein
MGEDEFKNIKQSFQGRKRMSLRTKSGEQKEDEL